MPTIFLSNFAKQSNKKILRGRRSEGFFVTPGSFFRKTPAGGNRALPFPQRSTRESADARFCRRICSSWYGRKRPSAGKTPDRGCAGTRAGCGIPPSSRPASGYRRDGTFPFELVAKPDALAPVRAETELHAGVGVDLKVYITPIVREREEKFHAAVLMDGAERGAALRSDVRFPRALENIERGIVVAELLLHADAAVRLPTARSPRAAARSRPSRARRMLCYRIAFHSACPPRYTALRFSAASHTTKSASFPTAMEPISAS